MIRTCFPIRTDWMNSPWSLERDAGRPAFEITYSEVIDCSHVMSQLQITKSEVRAIYYYSTKRVLDYEVQYAAI